MEKGWKVYPNNPQTIGPLTINKDRYMLGEVIFITLELHPLETGSVEFLNEKGWKLYGFKFNGSANPSPNLYFRPMLEKVFDICTVDDLTGTWTVNLTGTTVTEDRMDLTREPRQMQFEVLNEVIAGDSRFNNWTMNVCTEEPFTMDDRKEMEQQPEYYESAAP